MVDEPASLEDYSLAVEAVKAALAAEDAAGGPVETPAPVAVPVEDASPAVAEASAPPVEDVPAPAEPAPAADPAHDAAVVVAQAAVADASAVDDRAAHLAAANADIDAALAQWPDSPQLQDLKSQIAALAS